MCKVVAGCTEPFDGRAVLSVRNKLYQPRKPMNKLVKQLSPIVKALNQTRTATRRRGRGRRSTIRAVPRTVREAGPWGRALPASYASHVKAAWHVKNMTQTTMHVSGCDLVTPLPGSITSIDGTDMYLFTVIPSNPAYWSGTRIGQVAPAYMNYRPLRMVFHYIPQVAVTQPGTVIMGTLWNGASPSADLQQTLVTSNGGVMINCYVPGCTQIQLAGNLQQNLFTLPGDLNPDTNSFLFVAVARGCTSTSGSSQVVPGYFFVEYEYVFKNPIGQAWDYVRSLPVPASEISFTRPNRSIVLLQQDGNFGPGTILDVEMIDGNVKPMYHGSDVSLTPTTLIQAFENGQSVANNSSIETEDNTVAGFAFINSSTGEQLEYIPIEELLVSNGGSVTIPSSRAAFALYPSTSADIPGNTVLFQQNSNNSNATMSAPAGFRYFINTTANRTLALVNKIRKVLATITDPYAADNGGNSLFLPNDGPIKIPDTSIILP